MPSPTTAHDGGSTETPIIIQDVIIKLPRLHVSDDLLQFKIIINVCIFV